MKYDILLDFDKILESYYDIRGNTKNRRKLIKYEMFLFSNIGQILEELSNKTYVHGKYSVFIIKVPKLRVIMSENLHDKIVNHLVSKYVLYPLLEPKLLDCNIASRTNMGTKFGIKLIKKYINNHKNNLEHTYILKCDIKKFFYSINHEILIDKLRDIINDKDIFDLVLKIIDSTNNSENNHQLRHIIDKEKKKINNSNLLFSDKQKRINYLNGAVFYQYGQGLTIGNMSSQILAIFYLNDLDHFIKEQLHIKEYIRYMDDLILFSDDYHYLLECLERIKVVINEHKLCLNEKTRIFSLKDGISFLGYRFVVRNNRLITLPSDKNFKIIRKRSRKQNDIRKNYNGYLKGLSVNANHLILR